MKTPIHDFDEGRERPVNYIQICESFSDSYPLGPIHGFQKDVIQNALDARAGRSSVNVVFDYVTNTQGEFLVVTDSQTGGLTGPYVSREDYEEDLPEDYHWARFEAFAFTKPNPDALGARGQGKFILMRASKDYLMYYDTLRADRVYRFGGTQAQRQGCPILPADPVEDPWEDDRGRSELLERCGMQPLEEIGTRIIVVNPRAEYVEALRSGTMASFISETWFRAIEKQRIDVRVRIDGEETIVRLEDPYPLPKEERGDIKLWVLGQDFFEDEVILPDSRRFRVKRFEIARLAEPVAEDMRGVAIVQGDMKIESRHMIAAPSDIAECVTGFIEFDRPLDRELRKGENQHPNHYSLKWRSSVPRAIKAYVEKQMEDFGRAKLGLGRDPREERKRRQSAAEERALRDIARFAHDLDIFGRRKGRLRPNPPPPPPPPKPIGVSIHGFAFPDPETAPRVPRGSCISGIDVEAYSRKQFAVNVVVAARVLHGDGVVETLLEPQVLTLGARETSQWPVELTIDEKYREPGEYRIRATMDDASTGERIDEVARRFWVDADPPFKAPFDVEQARGFPDPYERRQWLVSGYIGTAKVYYNVLHPAYIEAEQADEIQVYLRDIFVEAAIELVLNRPNLADGKADYHPLDRGSIIRSDDTEIEEVPLFTYQEIMRWVSDFRWRAMEV